MQDLDVKDKIILATLPNVIFDGWTDAALKAGAEEAGYEESMAIRAFPYGVGEALEHFADYINREMSAKMAEQDLDALGVGQRLELAMKIRLELESPYKEAVRKAMSFYAMPQNVAQAMKVLWAAVDEMWWACKDSSVDFNYYTKRASLGAVYSATMVYWLSDESEDSSETLAFYRNRLIDVIKAVKMRKKLFSSIGSAFSKLSPNLSADGLMRK
jgi:ubiquinone biosynthesis protein COQ9